MHLNTSSRPRVRAKNALRVGRGIGSGLGKTAGRGHKRTVARTGKERSRPVSKAARCRCSAVCRRSASARRSDTSVPKSLLYQARLAEG